MISSRTACFFSLLVPDEYCELDKGPNYLSKLVLGKHFKRGEVKAEIKTADVQTDFTKKNSKKSIG
ncbi:hypothetical protein Salpa_4092 [Sporomusa sp. KB1]|jgi:hypothetical protein|nr:hypothetical protein Salpa_4092 [Sporomusa sp. KB1]